MNIANHWIRSSPWRGVLTLLLLALTAAPVTASAACAGKLSNLAAYAGKYLADHNLLAAPPIAALIQRLPAGERLHLQRNLDVSGPIELHACHLVVSGNAPHMGTEQDAILDVDLATGMVVASIHGGGRIDIYVLADPAANAPDWQALPQDVREWAVKADMGFPAQPPRSLAQPGSVRLHTPSASAAATPTPTPAARSSAYPLTINFDKNAIKPTLAQDAAIRRAAGADFKQPLHPDQPVDYAAALVDLNDDGRPDLLVQYGDNSGFCGSAGCSGMIVMATADGYARKRIDDLPNFYGDVSVLAGTHHGMHDLQYGDSPVWAWNGKHYDIDKSDRPGANAPSWQTRPAAGRTLALVVPIDSTIKSLSVFCNEGKPVLAMLLKMPRPRTATTLTWVFNGWAVNVPVQPANADGTLWMTYLSGSELPEWLAHRGHGSIASKIARLVDKAYLRINGAMEGQVSLKDSTAATHAALRTCYRY